MLLKAVLLLLYFPSKIIETIIFFIIGKKIPIIVDMNSIFVTKELGSGFELDDAFLRQLESGFQFKHNSSLNGWPDFWAL